MLRASEKQAKRLGVWRSARGTRKASAGGSRPTAGQRGPFPRRSKYNARRTTVDGFVFASAAEARRYQVLMIRGRLGEIRNLELQPRFPLRMPDGTLIATYIGDFRYQEPAIPNSGADWLDVVEDVKGVRMPVYLLKRRLFQTLYTGITFREVQG